MSLTETAPDQFDIECQSRVQGAQRVLVGMLTAMADDYGALCLVETVGAARIRVSVLDSAYASGRAFVLAKPERRE